MSNLVERLRSENFQLHFENASLRRHATENEHLRAALDHLTAENERLRMAIVEHVSAHAPPMVIMPMSMTK
jgi:hypothetical protein